MFVDKDMNDVVIKPRNKFTDRALQRLASSKDIIKKKEALSMSFVNFGKSKFSGLFR